MWPCSFQPVADSQGLSRCPWCLASVAALGPCSSVVVVSSAQACSFPWSDLYLLGMSGSSLHQVPVVAGAIVSCHLSPQSTVHLFSALFLKGGDRNNEDVSELRSSFLSLWLHSRLGLQAEPIFGTLYTFSSLPALQAQLWRRVIAMPRDEGSTTRAASITGSNCAMSEPGDLVFAQDRSPLHH